MTLSAVGPYRLLEKLGSGAMGTVYLAVSDADPDRKVALKVMRVDMADDPGFSARFAREARAGTLVDHPGVVAVLDAGEAQVNGERLPYIVMERVRGQTVGELQRSLGRLPEVLCRQIGLDVARALSAIHEARIVHRDLKPDNVMITAGEVVKVMDLGVASLRSETLRLTATGQFLGSLVNAAPEQLEGRDASPAMDLYALGITLFELATGENPFIAGELTAVLERKRRNEVPPPSSVAPGISAFFDELVLALTATDPGDRPADALVVSDALRRGEAGQWWSERIEARRLEETLTARPSVRRTTGFVGRPEGVARLQSVLARAASGAGGGALVRGEAGVGKSRLVDEAVLSWTRDGCEARLLYGAFFPEGGDGYAAIRAALLGALSPNVERRLERLLPETADLVPAMAAFVEGVPRQGVPEVSAAALAPLIARVMEGLAAHRPVVLWIDDLHRADEDGRALVVALARAAASRRFAVLATARPSYEDSDAWAHGDALITLELDRLAPEETNELLRQALASSVVAESLADELHRVSGGVPFVLLSVLDELQAQGLLQAGPDGLEAIAAPSELRAVRTPTDVHAHVAARVNLLDERDRELLEVAACIGDVFDPDVVASAAERPLIGVLRDLARLEREAQLVRGEDRRFRFDHHNVYEVVGDGIHERLREAYHGRIADALAGRPDAVVDHCEHLVRAGRIGEALGGIVEVSRRLRADWQVRRAFALVEDVLTSPDLEPVDRLELLLLRADSLHDLARLTDETQVLEDVHEQALAMGDMRNAAEASVRLAWSAVRHGDWARARTLVEETVEAAGDELPVHLAAAAARVRAHDAMEHDHDDVDARVEETVRLYEAAGSIERVLGIRLSHGRYFAQRGRLDEAHEAWRASHELAQVMGHPDGQVIASGNLGALEVMRGRIDEALAHLRDALATALRIADLHTQCYVHGRIARLHARLGRLGECLEHDAQQLALLADMQVPVTQTATAIWHAFHMALVGRAEEALASVKRGLELAETHGFNDQRVVGLTVAAEIAIDQDRPTRAGALLDEAIALADAESLRAAIPDAVWLRAYVARDAGDAQTELACLRRIQEERLGDPGRLAAVAAALTSHGESVDAARERLEAGAPVPAVWDAWQSWWLLWRKTRLVPDLARAVDVLHRTAASLPPEAGRRFLAASPLRRQIMATWEREGQADMLETQV